MNDQQNDSSDKKSTPATLTDQDIKTTRVNSTRLFLGTLGITALAATAIVLGQISAPASAADPQSKKRPSDFPKGNSNSDATENKDSKAVDSDKHNSKEVDSNQNRLRDVKRSTDSN